MRKVFFSEDDRQTDRQTDNTLYTACALMMTLSTRCIERKKEPKRHLLLSLFKKNTHVLFRVLNPVVFFLSLSLSRVFSPPFFFLLKEIFGAKCSTIRTTKIDLTFSLSLSSSLEKEEIVVL